MEGPLIPEGETKEWVYDTIDWVTQPLKAASLFYSLYWLTEIKDESAASFDFMQVRGGLHRAFRVYGVASIIKELANADQHFRVDHYPWVAPDLSVDDQLRLLRTELRADEGYDPDYAHGLLEYSHQITGNVYFNVDELRKTLIGGEKYFDAISEPDKFLKHAEALFEIGPQDSREPEYGWEMSYGKSAWAGVCRHLRRSDSETKTMFVDQSWSIQHNTGIWLNKVQLPISHRDKVGEIYYGLQGQDPDESPRFSDKDVYAKALGNLLNQKKVANFVPVFAYANEWTDELEINLRRLGARHGVAPEDIRDYAAPVRITLPRYRWMMIYDGIDELSKVTSDDELNREFERKCDGVMPREDRDGWLLPISSSLYHSVDDWPEGLRMGKSETLKFDRDEANVLPKLLDDAQCLLGTQEDPPVKTGQFSIARKDLKNQIAAGG